MDFKTVVRNTSTSNELKRVANAYVIDFRSLYDYTYSELRYILVLKRLYFYTPKAIEDIHKSKMYDQ
jgi:hypothetical protein